ncbi:HEAT repeat domain-containing protein [Polyangium fumosum]|uniref:HEAT repeat domain-containing protein n=1 Tax=Polyangium fumosum TaxID=889272 RepID=A0A4V6WQM5_9BACT|nr:HEAT repeat domain-containing protein [Polyangium fumosum]TKD00630.1 hypothetical protein E8A74_33415 [Polyangium fumosum]
MKAKRILGISLVAAGLVLSAFTGAANAADGVWIGPERLAAQDRATLVQAINVARRENPAAFDTLARLREDMPTLDAQKRGRYVPVAAILKGLGKDALLPMLNELAIEAKPRGDMSDDAWHAWRVGLVEAVGSLRDGRAAPVLFAIIDTTEMHTDLVRAAASALGKLGTDAAAQKLVALAKKEGPKQKGVLAGMGDCRRLVVAEALASTLLAHPDAETAILVARSLGDVGSAWAWKTPIIAASGEEAVVRATAARALVASYLRYEGDARVAITKAVLMVDHASTPDLAEAAKRGARPGDQAALDALVERFRNSPLRR